MLHRASVNPFGLCLDTLLKVQNVRRFSTSLATPRLRTINALLDTRSTDLSAAKQIEVNGFIRSVRKQKRVAFAALGDGTTLDSLQVVMTPKQAET